MNKFHKICFIGGGAWGQALAITLARIGYRSSILVSDPERAKIINENKSTCFKNLKYPNLIEASVEKSVLEKCDLAFISTESFRVDNAVEIVHNISPESKLIITSKGFSNKQGDLFANTINKNFPKKTFGILTGPTFADEVANNLPSAAIIASSNKSFSQNICDLFSKSCLRLYLSDDPIGACVSGAIKNIIAIGAGISDGLKLGDNAKAALISRGIAEVSRIILALGGKKDTAFGLAGIGDMTLTCSSSHSRNMSFGIRLVNNDKKEENDLVEGFYAVRTAYNIAKKLNIDTPIINSINDVVNNKSDVKDAIVKLLKRPKKEEFNHLN